MPVRPHSAVPIIPCNDLASSVRFYRRLGFIETPLPEADRAEYRILEDRAGGELHLQPAVPGWVRPGRNPFGVYIATSRLREIAAKFRKTPQKTAYGMLEITLSDPDETLVRIGWPVAARTRAERRKRPSEHPRASRAGRRARRARAA